MYGYVGGAVLLLAVLVGRQLWQGRRQHQQALDMRYQAAFVLYQKGQYARAREGLADILAEVPTHANAARILARIHRDMQLSFAQAEEALRLGQWKNALAIYQDILKKDPENVRAGVGRELAAARHGAQKAYQMLQQENVLLAQARERKNARAAAMAPYEAAMEVYYSPHHDRRGLLNGITHLSAAVRRDPHFADAYFQRGRIYHRLSFLDQALADYQQCLTLNHRLLAPQYYQLRIWYRRFADAWSDEEEQQAWEKLKPWIVKLLQKVQTEERGFYRELLKAFLLFMQHKVGKRPLLESHVPAFKLAQDIRRRYPLLPEGHFLCGEIADRLGQTAYPQEGPQPLQVALKAFNRALALDPYNGEGYAQRGRLYCYIGEYRMALQDLKMAMRLNYQHKDVFFLSSLCHTVLGDPQAGMRQMNQIVARWGDKAKGQFFRIHQGWYHMLFGDTRYSAKVFTLAVDYIQRHRLRDQKHLTGYLLRGLLYSKIGQPQKAVQDFRDLLELSAKTRLLVQWRKLMNLVSTVGEDRFVECLKTLADPFAAAPEKKAALFTWIAVMNLVVKNVPLENSPKTSVLHWILLEHLEKEPGTLLRAEENFRRAGATFPLKLSLYMTAAIYRTAMQRKLTQFRGLFSATGYYQRASLYFTQNRRQACREDLEAALDLDGRFMKGHYALATVLALAARQDPQLKTRALYHLKRALECGWPHAAWCRRDPHFRALHDTPAFEECLRSPVRPVVSPDRLRDRLTQLEHRSAWREILRYLRAYRQRRREQFRRYSTSISAAVEERGR